MLVCYLLPRASGKTEHWRSAVRLTARRNKLSDECFEKKLLLIIRHANCREPNFM